MACLFFGMLHLKIWIDRTFFFAHIFEDDFSDEKTRIRLYHPFFLFFETYSTLACYHAAFSLIAVALGDSPERWPPLFGDIREAYTVRRFWK